jgi:hypothetical protein
MYPLDLNVNYYLIAKFSQTPHPIFPRCLTTISLHIDRKHLQNPSISSSTSLKRGQRVELEGFGSFGLKERRSREGRNPKTGKSVNIAASGLCFLKLGKS